MAATFKNYISFSRKEAIGAVALAAIIVPFAILPFLNKKTDGEVKAGDDDWISVSQVLDEKAPANYGNGSDAPNTPNRSNYAAKENRAVSVRLFKFDPNTATPEELKQLGFRDKTIQILSNYRNKGGKFREAYDLQKIYGLRPQEFERLKPFIVIGSNQARQISYTNHNDKTFTNSVPNKDYKRKVVVIDVNIADTAAFQSLYGIGSKLAARIVNFRNKLGGFYSIDQVGETYGVPDSTFQKIKPYLKLSDGGIKKMNINTASYDELNAHPYVSSKLAFQIMKYRKENGGFNNLENLSELVAQTSDSFEKVVNYLTL